MAPTRTARVQVVTGDTEVVERGHADADLSPHSLRPGDHVLVSGRVGDHRTAIMLARGEFELSAPVEADPRCLRPAVDRLLDAAGPSVRCMRDATHGGVASVLNELARASHVAILVREDRVPVQPAVAGACEILGIDPLHLANDGCLVAVVGAEAADAALAALRSVPGCEDAADIGTVGEDPEGMVLVQSGFGGRRLLDALPTWEEALERILEGEG